MADPVAARIADKYIARDGSNAVPARRALTIKQEAIVLDALRRIAKGDTGGVPMKGDHAQKIARAAMNDILQPLDDRRRNT